VKVVVGGLRVEMLRLLEVVASTRFGGFGGFTIDGY
jgi:hypothetical protein